MGLFSARGLSTAPVSTVLDEGIYEVRIESCESILSKQKQTPGIKMDLVVQNGPIQNSGARSIGRHIFHTLYLAESGDGREVGLQKLAKLCRAADVEQTDDLDLNDFIGKTINVKLKQRMYNGEPQEEVTDYRKPSIG